MYGFPRKPLTTEEILSRLERLSSRDLDPFSGRMFGHTYDTGIEELRRLAWKAYELYLGKTMLDFTVYPSILELEREVVAAVASLVNADEDVVGNFTYGGTESIMLAVKAARDYFTKRNPGKTPSIILPVTGHPAFVKAAEYLGLRVVKVPVNPETFKVDIEKEKEAIGPDTAMIVGSAPNYPVGVVDDIKALSDIAVDHKKWLHVDACIGGFVLPFFRKLGEPVPDFDFKLEGVTSISVDLHKYGYAPRGSSVILYRNKSYRLNQLFVHASWPGYPLVNTAVLSTRSAGPLAAAWATIHFLGEEGYLKLASMLLRARKAIVSGIREIGLSILGEPEASIVAFTSDEVNPSLLANAMKKRGWYIQVQPGSRALRLPKSIHLTLSPVHEKVARDFLKDLAEAVEEVIGQSPPDVSGILQTIMEQAQKAGNVEQLLGGLAGILGISEGRLPEDLTLINELMYELDPMLVEEALKYIINELFA